jgi:hypothetical protein
MPAIALAASLALLAPAQPSPIVLGPADRAKAFTAAGFARRAGQWRKCGDPGTAGYLPGRIDSVADRNGDGLPEAVIMEDSSYCFGMTGTGFALVGKQANGSWRLLFESAGIPTFLARRGIGGWPDIEVGGPGFCFPRYRWNGKAWRQVGTSYDGKPCRNQ